MHFYAIALVDSLAASYAGSWVVADIIDYVVVVLVASLVLLVVMNFAIWVDFVLRTLVFVEQAKPTWSNVEPILRDLND